MTWVAVAMGGAALGGAYLSSQGSKSAAQTQASAQMQGANTQLGMFNTIRAQENPFIQSGYSADAALNYLMGLKPTGYSASAYNPTNSQSSSGSGSSTSKEQGIMDKTKSAVNAFLDPAGIGGGGGMSTSDAKSILDPGSILGGLRYGGLTPQGRDVIVGEEGPEVLHMSPGSTGFVTPNPTTLSRMMLPGRLTGGPVGTAEPNPSIPGDRSGTSMGNVNAPAPTSNGFLSQGTGNLPAGYLTQTFDPKNLQNMPGYQFQLQQGQEALQNSQSASIGALSGPALKQLMQFNQGLAANNYSNYFNQFQTQQNNIFDRLSGLAQLGQNAASGVGSSGTQLGTGIAQAQAAAGGSLAGGQLGAANAYAGAANNVPLYMLMAGNGGGGSGQTGYPQ